MSKGCILVAEDSALLRAVARRALTEHGYSVHAAADGVEALEQVRAHRPDVVLCDLTMPRLDGYGVLEAIKADPAIADTPVVFLTSHTRSDQAAEGLRRGAYDYLRKPFDDVELIARMHAAVRTKRLQDELQRLLSTDALTGLANRRRAEQALTAAIAGGGAGVSVAILDVDHFKSVNDQHGHEAGDDVLKEVGARLRGIVATHCTVARWGGEEFLLVCARSAKAADLSRLAHETIRSEPFALSSGATLNVTVSAGWSAWRGEGDDSGGLLRRADIALYAAKEAGRDRVVGPSCAPASA